MADRYLRQTTSGHIYIWAPHFAARDDMVEVERTKNGRFVPVKEAPQAEVPQEEPERKTAIDVGGE